MYCQNHVFHRAEVFILMKCNIILLIDHTLGVVSKKSLPNQGYLDFFLCYLLKVLYFSVLYLELWYILSQFLGRVKHLCLDFFFFIWRHPAVPAIFVKKTILFSLNYLCFFDKDQLTVFVLICFWILYSVIDLSTLYQYHIVFIIVILQQTLEPDSVSSLILLFFFYIMLAILSLLSFTHELQNQAKSPK